MVCERRLGLDDTTNLCRERLRIMEERKHSVSFVSNSSFSLGVEIEFQVLDDKSLNLTPLAPVLLENSPKKLSSRITHELIQSILELQTGVCSRVRDVENDLMETCSMAEELARDNGCLLYAASLHPFAHYEDQILTSNERYERIMDELQIVGRQFIPQGLHVHVGLPDGDTAIRVCNVIQAYLPLLLSLSTSSPFFCGRDTGLLSYRTKLFEALPLAGIYEYYHGWSSFLEDLDILIGHEIIHSINDLWWDARPNAKFGTVEIRICDLPARFSDILALVAFVQGLVVHIVEEREEHFPFSLQILRANKWQAVRHGLEGRFIDPTGWLSKNGMPTKKAIESVLKMISPYTNSLQSTSYLEKIERILSEGTSGTNQKRIYAKSGIFTNVIKKMHQEFWQ